MEYLNHIILILTILLFISSLIFIINHNKKLKKDLDGNYNKQKKYLDDHMEKLLSRVNPRVVHCVSPEEVSYEAVLLIEETIKARDKHRENDKDNYPFISIFGAVDLGEHHKKYTNSLSEALEKRIRISRYARFLAPEELKSRKKEIIKQYSEWLSRQKEELLSNEHSTLFHNIRAPQWGSANSSLITNIGILEIKASGHAALAIYDESIARTMKNSLHDELEKASNKNKERYTDNNMEKLEKHISEVKSILENMKS